MRRVAFLLVVTIALAGCGGGSKSSEVAKPLTKTEYQAKITQIAKDVAASIGSTTSANTITKDDAETLAKGLVQFAGELDKVTPPAEVTELHTQLVAVMRQLGDEFPKIADQLRTAKDPSAAIDALFGSPAIQQLSKLQMDFKKKGYDLDLNS